MGYTLGKVGKDRTIAAGRREDAGTDVGKGDRGGLAGPLLNFAMLWATAGAAGITIIAGCRCTRPVCVLSKLPYS